MMQPEITPDRERRELLDGLRIGPVRLNHDALLADLFGLFAADAGGVLQVGGRAGLLYRSSYSDYSALRYGSRLPLQGLRHRSFFQDYENLLRVARADEDTVGAIRALYQYVTQVNLLSHVILRIGQQRGYIERGLHGRNRDRSGRYMTGVARRA